MNVTAANINTQKGRAFLDFTLEVSHLNDLKDLIRELKTVNGVQRVFRVNRSRKK